MLFRSGGRGRKPAAAARAARRAPWGGEARTRGARRGRSSDARFPGEEPGGTGKNWGKGEWSFGSFASALRVFWTSVVSKGTKNFRGVKGTFFSGKKRRDRHPESRLVLPLRANTYLDRGGNGGELVVHVGGADDKANATSLGGGGTRRCQ